MTGIDVLAAEAEIVLADVIVTVLGTDVSLDSAVVPAVVSLNGDVDDCVWNGVPDESVDNVDDEVEPMLDDSMLADVIVCSVVGPVVLDTAEMHRNMLF